MASNARDLFNNNPGFDGRRIHQQLDSQTVFQSARGDSKVKSGDLAKLKEMYKHAVPDGPGQVRNLDDDDLKRVADQMYKTFYAPFKPPALDITISRDLRSQESGVSCVNNEKGWVLELTPEAFTKSPSYLGPVLGHELIHVTQCRRANNPSDENKRGRTKPYYWFAEVESSS